MKLIAAGQPYRVVAEVFEVGAAGVHERIKEMPEATRRDLERAGLRSLVEYRELYGRIGRGVRSAS